MRKQLPRQRRAPVRRKPGKPKPVRQFDEDQEADLIGAGEDDGAVNA